MHALVCVTYIVFAATAMMPNTHNHEQVNKIYERLSKKEKSFFIKISGEALNTGYYSQLEGLAHKVEVAHMQTIVEQNMRTMKRSKEYRSILRKAGANQQHITRHLEECLELGRQHAEHANSDTNRHSMCPGDIYTSLYEEEVPVTLPTLPRLPSGEQVVRVLLISFLILLTLTAIAGLIGACVCPQLPVFNRVYALLKY